MIKYLGSKRTLLPSILSAVKRLGRIDSVFDVFSGTARVGHALKQSGHRVIANDLNHYAHTLAQCYVEAEASTTLEAATALIDELNQLPGEAGYITETYCRNSRYFQPPNGERIDAMREQIERWDLPPLLKAICLTSLMEAADRIDSTTGVQMAYLKQWAPRSFHPIQLRVPHLLNGQSPQPCQSLCLEASAAAAQVEADCAYLDPPYNQHSYLGNYHIWESLVKWDKPEVYGIACKRVDCRSVKSEFNSKPRSSLALSRLLDTIRCPNLIVSFNNEGFIERASMEALLAQKGYVSTVELAYRRYVGAQIGIYNPSGQRVGEVSHLRNKEFIYIVSAQPLEESLAETLNSTPVERTAAAA